MQKVLLWSILGFSLFSSIASANAEQWRDFVKIAKHTIDAIKNNNPGDIDNLITMQEQLMELGLKACQEYARRHPQDERMLRLVVDNADKMKFLSLEEIEEQWHAKRFLLRHGIATNKLLENSATGSLMDTVVHPATAFIALRQYRRTKNRELLRQVDLELSEAIIKLAHIE